MNVVLLVRRSAVSVDASMPPLADTFMQVVDSLPDDWTDLELDLRIFDERRYVDAAVLMVTCNAQPLLEGRLALAAARRPPLRPRRVGARRPHRAEAARRRRHRGRACGPRAAHRPRRGHAGVGPARIRPRDVQADPGSVGPPADEPTEWPE